MEYAVGTYFQVNGDQRLPAVVPHENLQVFELRQKLGGSGYQLLSIGMCREIDSAVP